MRISFVVEIRTALRHHYRALRVVQSSAPLGPMAMRVASFFPFRTTYYLNGHSFIEQELNRNKIGFRKNDNAFPAVDDVAALQGAADRLTAHKISQIFGFRVTKKPKGKLNTTLERIEHGHHISREKFLAITGRFATFQAPCLNVHVEFPLLQRLALPITVGTAKFPGVKIHDTRMIRLMEVLLHGGTTVGGWTAKQIHDALRTCLLYT